MKLAILGGDEVSLELVRWAVAKGGHELMAIYEAGKYEAELRAIALRATTGESWEALVLRSTAEAVLVGQIAEVSSPDSGISARERRDEQLRKLTQAAVPMIVVCPACEAIVGFEIEMIRRDVGGVIVPLAPAAEHPAVARLGGLVAQGDNSPVGTIEQIMLAREQADRSREAVLFQLARDATLLRRLIGAIRSVNATGPATAIGRDPLGPKPKELPSLANLSVFLTGDEGLGARWSVGPGGQLPSAVLSIVGQRGKATLHMPAADEWRLIFTGDVPSEETYPPYFDPQYVFRRLRGAAEDESGGKSLWLDACRDQEATETVDRSLLRGRTIELFGEEHTETDSFKGVMSVGGCLILLLVLGVTFMAALAEGLRLPLRDWPIVRMWPICLLVPAGIFLLMQLLQLAAKRNDSGSG